MDLWPEMRPFGYPDLSGASLLRADLEHRPEGDWISEMSGYIYGTVRPEKQQARLYNTGTLKKMVCLL